MLGQRYGTISLPALASKEFEAILKAAEGAQLSILNEWYKKDTNAIPPVYVLQPKSSQPEVKWPIVEQELREILQQCVEKCLQDRTMTKEESTKYFSSGNILHSYLIFI